MSKLPGREYGGVRYFRTREIYNTKKDAEDAANQFKEWGDDVKIERSREKFRGKYEYRVYIHTPKPTAPEPPSAATAWLESVASSSTSETTREKAREILAGAGTTQDPIPAPAPIPGVGAAAKAKKAAAKPTQKELTRARELGKTGYWAGKKAPAQDAKILDMCHQRSHDAMMALMTAWSEGWHAEHQKEVDKELLGKGIIMPGMEAATKPPQSRHKAATKQPRTPAPSLPAIFAPAPATVLPDVPMGLGGGGIAPIPGVGAAPKRRQPAAKPAKPKKAAAPKPKPPKKAAKPKNGKAKKTAPELTAAQRKRLAAKGSITIKRGGKFVTVRG